MAILTANLVPPATATPPPATQPAPGVTTTTLTLQDSQRNTPVTLFLTLPARAESNSRVVLLSSGAGSKAQSFEPLMRAWSARGYTCIAPDHRAGQAPEDHAADLAWILHRPPELVRQLPHPLDFSAVAVVGEGQGCAAALRLVTASGPAATTVPATTAPTSRTFGQVALLILSNPEVADLLPAGGGIGGLPVPLLLISAESPPESARNFAPRRRFFDGLSSTDRYFLTFKGPVSLGVGPERLSAGARLIPARNNITAAFLDAYFSPPPSPARDLFVSGSVIAPYRAITSIEAN